MEITSFAGIDLHKASLTIAVRDASGNRVKTVKFDTKCVNKIRDFVSGLPRPIHCAIESVGMYEWLWELLEPVCDRLILADATQLKFQAGNRKAKTDKIDARFISWLLYRGDIPEAFVPDKTTRQFRKLCRHWRAMAEMMTDIKIRMRWILNQNNLPGPANINGDSARRWFLAHGMRLDPTAAFTFSQFLQVIENIECQQLPLRRQILEFAIMPQFKDDIELIKTVPGIADIISAIIVAEIAGFDRFGDAEAIACYAGLTERTRESDGRRTEGHISASAPDTLRWALVEAAITLIRSDPFYRNM
jgi:transposase